MHDAQGMRIRQRVGHGGHDLDRLRECEALRSEQVGQGHAGDKIAHQVRQAMLVADLVHRHNMRMPQLGGAPALADKALPVLGRHDRSRVGHLDGDQPIELGIPRFPHRAERPGADLLQQVEFADAAVQRRAAHRAIIVQSRAERFVDFELFLELSGELRKAAHVFGQLDAIAARLADHHFLIQQLQQALGVLFQRGILFEQRFHQHALTALPAGVLLTVQAAEQVLVGGGFAGRNRRYWVFHWFTGQKLCMADANIRSLSSTSRLGTLANRKSAWFKKRSFRVTPGAKLRSTKVMVTRCWSNFDHRLGLVHNSWRCCDLQWRADQGDGLARARTSALSLLFIGTPMPPFFLPPLPPFGGFLAAI